MTDEVAGDPSDGDAKDAHERAVQGFVAAMLCSLGMSGVSKFVDISQPRLLKRGTHVVEI
jgi:hypothetical protein